MFDCAIDLMIEFIKIIPIFTCVILIFNICSDLLWGGK